MKDDEFRKAFDELVPPAELEVKTRNALREKQNDQMQKPMGRGATAVAKVSPRAGYIIAAIVATVIIMCIIFPLMFGLSSNGYEPDSLRTFSSINEVKRYVSSRAGASQSGTGKGSVWTDMMPPTAVNDTAEQYLGSNGSGQEHSTTNNQVAGVSESDIVHTDGNYIYSLGYYSLSVIDIREGKFEYVAGLEFKDFSPSEMFLMEEYDMLVVLGTFYSNDAFSNGTSAGVSDCCCYWSTNAVAVKIFSIPLLLDADPRNDAPVREMTFENAYLSASRMIDGKLYLFLNNYRIFSADGDVLLPEYTDTKAGGLVQLEAKDFFATPDNGRDYNYSVAAGIDLAINGEAKVQAYFGSTGTLYASKTSFYISYSRYKKDTGFWNSGYTYLGLGIMRFAINGVGLEYKGFAKVEGYTVNQFSFDEYTYDDGGFAGRTFFRVATTRTVTTQQKGSTGDVQSISAQESCITVFDGNMKKVGFVGGLGKGERIYSVRFNQKQAVVVTYLQMDPLYVIDLAAPTAPFVKSELKIPGVSDYLHFIDIADGFVFAVGRAGVGLEQMKVSLFDIRGETTLETAYFEVESESGYSYSEATYNHKAIMHFVPQSMKEEVFAMPVNGSRNYYDAKSQRYVYEYTSELRYYSLTRSGEDVAATQVILGFHVQDGLSSSIKNASSFYYYRDTVRRSVLAGDYVYLVGYSGIERYNRLDLPKNTAQQGKIIVNPVEYWGRV